MKDRRSEAHTIHAFAVNEGVEMMNGGYGTNTRIRLTRDKPPFLLGGWLVGLLPTLSKHRLRFAP